MQGGLWRVAPVGTGGHVVVSGSAVLVVDGDVDAAEPVVAALGFAGADETARALLARTSPEVLRISEAHSIEVAAAVRCRDHVLVFGTTGVPISVVRDGAIDHLDGRDSVLVNAILRESFDEIHLGVIPLEDRSPALDLVAGVVVGSGAVIGRRTSAGDRPPADHGEVAAPPRVVAPAPVVVPEPVVVVEPEPRDDGPKGPGRTVLVWGVHCPEGHHNRDIEKRCSTCGAEIADHTLVEDVRPSLGTMELDDGRTIDLTADILVGREPEPPDPAVLALALPDSAGTVSKAHFTIKLVEWGVTVTDLKSLNGTFLLQRDATEEVRLGIGVPNGLRDGATIYFGERSMVFRAYRGGAAPV